MRLTLYIALLLMALCQPLTSGCSRKAHNTEEPSYVRKVEENTSVIVFIHGVNGRRLDTWKHPEASTSWPEMLTSDSHYDDYNIYAYCYSSPRVRPALSIDELGDDLNQMLKHDRIFEHNTIVFVAHSMGGLIAADCILRYAAKDNWESKVALVYLFGTPLHGSELTRLISMLGSKNPQFKDMMPIDGNAALVKRIKDWSVRAGTIPVYVGHETLKIAGDFIVPVESTTGFPAREYNPVRDATHITMVKPRNARSGPYILLTNAIVDLSKGTLRPDPLITVTIELDRERLDRNFTLVAHVEGQSDRLERGTHGIARIALPLRSATRFSLKDCPGFILAVTKQEHLINGAPITLRVLPDGPLPPLHPSEFPRVEHMLPSAAEVFAPPLHSPSEVTWTYENRTDRQIELLVYRCHDSYQPYTGGSRTGWFTLQAPRLSPESIEKGHFTLPSGVVLIFARSRRDAQPHFLGCFDLYRFKKGLFHICEDGSNGLYVKYYEDPEG